MIDRIVQMTFRLEEVEAFRALFEQHKQSIRNQPGCQLLRLVQDVHDPRLVVAVGLDRHGDLRERGGFN